MMRNFLVALTLLLFCLPPARAQRTDPPQTAQARRDSLRWEEVLQAYQSFCELAANARSGDAQARTELRRQADTIDSLLQQTRGSRMTASQKQRFDRMKKRYASVIALPDLGSAPSIPAPAPVRESSGKTRVVRDTVVILQEVRHTDTVRIVEQIEKRVEVPVERIAEVPAAMEDTTSSFPMPVLNPDPSPAPGPKPKPRPRYLGMAQALVPDFSGGLMVGVMDKAGIYLRFDSNFSRRATDYSCTADGQTDYGRIWTSGRSEVNRFSVTSGLLLHPLPWLSLYTGAGYGERRLCWEDTSGRWASVADRSHRSVAADFGAIFLFDRFALSAGVSTLAFSRFDALIGLGFLF